MPKYNIFICDFETTVYEGQTNTAVWAAACVSLEDNSVKIFGSIDEQFEYFKNFDGNVMAYYHNLKFDGSFWLSYLMLELGFDLAFEREGDFSGKFLPIKDMKNNTFTTCISSTGQWYRITIKTNGKIIDIRDSLKLLPFSVKKIGEDFGTEHKKLEMDYTGFRYPNCFISDTEREYIKNDVLVVKEGLTTLFNSGHNRLTIGSCCLAEYKKSIGGKTYDRWFPQLYDMAIDKKYGASTAGDYIRHSYHGGWCYLAKGKASKLYKGGCTADVNSLYPSMMSSCSGNTYPTGTPTFWSGNYIPDVALDSAHYYFVRVKTRFYLKPNKLPFIQLKNTLAYRPTEMLETSDMFNYKTGKYYRQYIDFDGSVKEAIITLTLTQTDYELLKDQYNLEDFEILDGCYFDAKIGIFDKYINKYKEIKLHSKGAMRQLAKLFLNNLYGKMAASPVSNFKVPFIREDKSIGFETIFANDKIAGYIAVGSAITSYSRNFTIRAAQANYHGINSAGFIYADTDSIHCDLPPEQLKGINIHDKNFCCWKIENEWDEGFYVRQKTYIERCIKEDSVLLDKPSYSIKCAGMPDKCKKLFVASITGEPVDNPEQYTDSELTFANTKRTIYDFKVGLKIEGKLMPKRIRGGTLLISTTYELR